MFVFFFFVLLPCRFMFFNFFFVYIFFYNFAASLSSLINLSKGVAIRVIF